MKRSILLLLCALMAILCLAGCDFLDNILGNDDPEEHMHTYASTLSSDANGHWYAATCECEDAGKKDFAAHVDLTGGLNGGKDGKCDTCAYAVCAHTYATEWSKDATHHWHAVTCGCEVAVADKAAHTYTEDGCVCGYMQTLDLTEAVYNVPINFTEISDHATWWSAVAPVTFTVAVPGTYALVNDDNVDFYADAASVGDDYSFPINSVTTTEAGESVTVYAYKEFWTNPGSSASYDLAVYATAIEIAAERGAAELLRGTVYTLVWTAPAAGTYYIDDLELPVVWDDWMMNDFFVLEATEAGQEFSFTVYYYGDDFGVEGTENFTLNWFIQPFTAEALTLGQAKELSVVLGAPTALTFTATVAGTYKITSNNPATCYGVWNVSEYGAMMFWSDAGDQEVVLMAGETFTFYVMVEEAATDVDVTVTGTLEAELEQLVVGTDKTVTFANGDEAFDGACYVIIATEAGWYKVVADGLVAVDSNYDDFSDYVYLEAGEIVAVNVYYGDDDEYDPSSSYTVSLVYSAEEPTPEVTYDTELYVNWYSNVLVEAEGTTPVTLTVTSAGTYVISVETLNGQLADRTGMNIATAGQSITLVVTEQDLTDFDGVVVLPYFVSTTDGLGGVIEIYVAKQAEEEEEEDYGEYVKDIDVTVTDTYLMEYIDSYSFTATVAGDYAFFVPAGLGFWIDGEAAPRIDYQDITGGGNLGGVVVVTIQAGETLGFSVGAATRGDYTIELYADEPSDIGGGGSDTPVTVPTLSIGDTQINAADATYEYTAAEAGKLTLTAGAAIMGPVTITYTVNGGAANTLALSSSVELTLAVGDKVVITVVAEGYSSITAAWAATSGGEGGGQVPEPTPPAPVVVGSNTVNVTDADITNQVIQTTFTVTEEGTYSFQSNNLMIQVVTNYGPQQGMVYLMPGTYTVNLVTACISVAGEYTYNVTFTAPVDEDAEGTENNPIEVTLPAENLAANGDGTNMTWYTFTTTEAGTLTITYSNANSWVYVKTANGTDTGSEEQVLTFTLAANTAYSVALGVWTAEDGVTATLTFEAGAADGGDEPVVANKGDMYIDTEATFEVTDDDITAGAFAATLYTGDAGEYNISGIYVLSVATTDGTVIERNDNYYFELEAYTQYIVTFSAEYLDGAGTYTATAEYQYPEGHENNPIWIYGLGDAVTATYKGDYLAVWYTFYANANGTVTITTADEAATIMLKPVGGQDVTNCDDEGNWLSTVTLTVMQGRQYLIGVVDANWSNVSRDITFTPALTEGDYAGDGTMNTPNIAVDGANTANTPAWDNTYFVYTAADNGVLTLTTESNNCSWAIATEFGNWNFVTDSTLTVKLEMDQKVYIAISAADNSATAIDFTASFEADPKAVYYEEQVVTDGSAANAVQVAENTWTEIAFQGDGQFVITWDNADAKVEFVAWGAPNTALSSGDIVTGNAWFGTTLMVYFEDYAAGAVNVTITPYVAESGANTLVLGENEITVQDTQYGDTYNLPVNAEETVTYVLTVGANAVIIVNGSDIYMDAGETVEITVPAGDTASVGIGAYSFNDNVAIVDVAVKA